MTQKELSYVEDAIGHEMSLIKICEDAINRLNDPSFKEFMESEITNHQNLYDELLTLLKEKANG